MKAIIPSLMVILAVSVVILAASKYWMEPVENFELYIDGGNSGFTDSNGQYRFTITNASINTNHNLQICYCFSTEGGCRQQKITITVQADECPVVCEDPVACSEIEITETIIGTL